MTDPLSAKAPHFADQHVGRRIRELRRRRRLSQESLAEAIDLTFQQVQKYERGANRVSASKLFELAAALNVDVGYFFDGLSPTGTLPVGAAEVDGGSFATAEGREVDSLLANLSKGRRRLVLDLARALYQAGNPPEPPPQTDLDVVALARPWPNERAS